MSTAEQVDVVVIGAGVCGCAIAAELAREYDVLVIEKGQVAGEASGLAAGLVAPTLFYADSPSIAQHANSFFREFDGAARFEFTERPRTELIAPADEQDARNRADRLAGEGFPVTFLEPDEAMDQYPMFDLTGFAGIVEYGDAGWIDPYQYTISLKAAAEERGATFETGRVSDVRTEGGSVTGVRVEDEIVHADHVVCATGWRTPELLADIVALPIRPFRLQCATLDPGWALDESFPLGRVGREDLYFRPEHNGNLLVGGGEYLEPTPEQTCGGGGIDDDFRMHVADLVPSFLRDFERAQLVNGWAGVDAATPDTRPIIDTVGPDGLVVATGFNGLGMVNSPIAATAVTSLVADEPAPFSLDHFSLSRFERIATDFEVRGTFAADPEDD